VAIKDFKLSEDSYDAQTYANYIGALGGFVAQFPDSANTPSAKTTLAAFEAEKKRVDAGEMKLDGKWLSKEDVQKERVQILGNSYLRHIKRFAAAGRLQDVMIAFEQLEKAAPGSAAFPEGVDIARRSAVTLKQAADAGVTRLRAQATEEKKTLDKLAEPQRSATAKELKYMHDRAEIAVAAVERTGVKWMPLNPATEKSLTALAVKAGTEVVRLGAIPVDAMRQSLKEVEKGKTALAAGDLSAAEAAFTKASQLWSGNEQVQRSIGAVAAAKKAEADKVAADKLAAENAAKAAAEAAAAAKMKESLQPAPTPAPTPAVAEEEPKVEEKSFLAKPAFWVILTVLLIFGALIGKVVRKFKDPSGNILDQ
jgi:hypothetical protein